MDKTVYYFSVQHNGLGKKVFFLCAMLKWSCKLKTVQTACHVDSTEKQKEQMNASVCPLFNAITGMNRSCIASFSRMAHTRI